MSSLKASAALDSASDLALLHQVLVLGMFPLICFLNMLLPGHNEFPHDELFCHLGGNDCVVVMSAAVTSATIMNI